MQEFDLVAILTRLWNFQLMLVDNAPITIGKLVIGLGLLVAAYFLARMGSRAFSQKVLSRLTLQNSLRFTLEKLSFYVFYIFLSLFVLQVLSIPVTIFSVIGGALALGIGFGSQNVVNNFISGLIVMIEQPVRAGDWIEIDGVFGVIDQIGSRSTLMHTMDNKQIIVPNSFFLEKMFVNWTLSDSVVGGNVSVGVAYGSDVQLVKRLLLQAAQGHVEILKSPEPFVFFNEFGESSLDFNLYFRIQFSSERTINRVSSELRFRIDEMFRENKISIPFPHRQMLFDNKEPLVVRIENS